MELINNHAAKDVSYADLMEFLEQDKVNDNEPEGWKYCCIHFVHDLHNNAESAGIRCAVVWTANHGHVFNAFETTDKGIVFVDVSTGFDSVAYEQDGILVVDTKIREGIGDKAIMFLGNPIEFAVEW